VNHELTVEEGSDVRALAKACSVFSTKSVEGANSNGARLLG
jgi:hypothetical protein